MTPIICVPLLFSIGLIVGAVAVEYIYRLKVKRFLDLIDSHLIKTEPKPKADKRKWWVYNGRNETANHLRATARAVFGVEK